MSKFVPESVLEKLVVGARVRYIPNYECERPPMTRSVAGIYKAIGHEAEFDAEGKTGIIIRTDDTTFARHPYEVEMDISYRFGNEEWDAITLAADELALVEDEA